MKLDEQLRSAYQEETKDWIISDRVKHNVMNGTHKKTTNSQRSKTWRVSILLLAALLIPTGAYAGYTYLADSIYGSRENVTSLGGTTANYERLEAKLQQAKAHFTESEFELYMGLLKQFAQMALTHADAQGQMNPNSWSIEEQEKYKQITAKLQPFFNKMEGLENNSPTSIPVSPRLMDEDEFWAEQFTKAAKSFTEEEYADFRAVYEQMKTYKTTVEDTDGSYHMDLLSKEQRAELDQLTERMSVYLEKIGLHVR